MATQTALNGGSVRPGFNGPDTLIGNLTEFGSDVATLAELQAKLAAHDLKETVSGATLPLILLVIAGVLGVAAMPVLLLGIAELFVVAGMARPWALLLTAAGVLAIAAVIGLIAWTSFGKSFRSLNRSKEELVRNLNWVKAVVSSSGKRGRTVR